MAVTQVHQRQGASLRLVLMQQVQVLIDRSLAELRHKRGGRPVTLELAVVLQSGWAELADIAIDVLGGLLAADIEGVAQVIGSQSPLPLQDYLQQTKT